MGRHLIVSFHISPYQILDAQWIKYNPFFIFSSKFVINPQQNLSCVRYPMIIMRLAYTIQFSSIYLSRSCRTLLNIEKWNCSSRGIFVWRRELRILYRGISHYQLCLKSNVFTRILFISLAQEIGRIKCHYL